MESMKTMKDTMKYTNRSSVETPHKQQSQHSPSMSNTDDASTNLSCYSYQYPPELESLVVVKVERVDPMGIWGTLTDWGSHDGTCTAYLPIGSIGKEKGRGERKAQMYFLTRARRSIGKQRSAGGMTFVAYVQAIDAVSQSGVADIIQAATDIGAQRFHITVTRRGITDEIEKTTVELSRDIQLCARLLVDKAAIGASVSRRWARKVSMHVAYERALSASARADKAVKLEPERTPVDFLLNTIGGMEADKASAVLALLGTANNEDEDEYRTKYFADNLLSLCRQEKQRKSRAIAISVTSGIGGPKTTLPTHDGAGGLASHSTTFDTRHLIAAVQAASSISPPKECEEAVIAVRGNGKYTLSTSATPDLELKAREYLNVLTSKLQDAWVQSVCSVDTVCPRQLPKDQAEATRDLQPSLSIGVIGDVANGKSTMVKAISGKRTQAHSSEQQQHGITIRLGFANASVLCCQNTEGVCGTYSFLEESRDDGKAADLPACSKCGHTTKVVKRFSLVDCPGHAELMATMLAGSSSFDAVILAAAANVPYPTPQARQHLEAIKLSGIIGELGGKCSTVAIAQTKSELLADASKNASSRLSPEERLDHHAQQGRDNLVDSVAGTAPIFPVCSPLGLGLEAIAEWIANLPSEPASNQETGQDTASSSPQMTVLRSFDINRPGGLAKDLSGGVLGGTILGSGSISVGEMLEIRPGRCFPAPKSNQGKKKSKTKKDHKNIDASPEPFRVQPLHFRCTSLMTGKHQLSSASKGGLVAVGTSLDPLVCVDNRMVGSTVGPPGTLPPVWGPTLFMDHLQLVDILPESVVVTKETKKSTLKPTDLLEKGAEIRCHLGSATIKGVVVKVSKSCGKLEVRLDGPVCAPRGANAAIEGKDRSFVLVAHAKLVDGDVCLDGSSEEHNKCNEDNRDENQERNTDEDGARKGELVKRDAYYRKRFLKDLQSCKEDFSKTDGLSSSRISVPLPDISRDGGAHVLVSNFGVITRSLRREAGHLMTFLEEEGGLSCVLAGDRSSPAATALRVKWRGGRNFADRFSSILRKYIRAYVTCNQCRGAVTELLGAGNKTEQLCRRCNARRFVDKLYR